MQEDSNVSEGLDDARKCKTEVLNLQTIECLPEKEQTLRSEKDPLEHFVPFLGNMEAQNQSNERRQSGISGILKKKGSESIYDHDQNTKSHPKICENDLQKPRVTFNMKTKEAEKLELKLKASCRK